MLRLYANTTPVYRRDLSIQDLGNCRGAGTNHPQIPRYDCKWSIVDILEKTENCR